MGLRPDDFAAIPHHQLIQMVARLEADLAQLTEPAARVRCAQAIAVIRQHLRRRGGY